MILISRDSISFAYSNLFVPQINRSLCRQYFDCLGLDFEWEVHHFAVKGKIIQDDALPFLVNSLSLFSITQNKGLICCQDWR